MAVCITASLVLDHIQVKILLSDDDPAGDAEQFDVRKHHAGAYWSIIQQNLEAGVQQFGIDCLGGLAHPRGFIHVHGQQGDLPPDAHSFLEIEPDHVILTALKVAEEEGLIVRLWECAGQDAIATVNASGLGPLRAARKTDLLERDSEDLGLTNGGASIPVKARGLATARLLS